MKRYNPSKSKALTTFIGLLVIFALMFLTPTSNEAHRTVINMIEGGAGFIVLAILVTLLINISYVEIDNDKISYLQFDFAWKCVAPIKNIIGIGIPSRNWLRPVMYIWYDDPKNPGMDKYININQSVFDDVTLVKIALDLKAVNPSIKIDEKLQELINNPAMNGEKTKNAVTDLKFWLKQHRILTSIFIVLVIIIVLLRLSQK